MQIDPNSNPWFTPSAAPQGTSELDHLNKGLYAYVNAAHDPELKKQADTIFGRTVPFDNSETQATLIGRSWCSRSGYLADPVRYCRDNKLPLPPNWSGENAQLYTLIGQNYIGKAQEHFNNQKAAREKALADAQKDYTETMGELPSLLAKSIRSAGGEKGTPLTPQYLEKLTKYGAREGAIQSQQRAATAWMYMSAYMDDIDSMQSTGRDKLLDIANTLSDDKGQLDPHATAAFLMMMEDKATELQSTDSQFWADFADKFQNFLSRTEDQIGKAYTNKGKGWNSSTINPSFIVSTNPELDPNWLASQDNEPDPTYNDPRVEQLYGYMQRAINTAIAPSEKAEWYAKLLSEMGGLVGESAIPMALGIAASAATAGAGAGAFLAATAGYGAGFAATAPSTINASIAEAYAQGKVNPELYGTLEGIGQAAAENIGGPATSLKLFTKTAGKLTNWAASRTAGSRFLANQYARTTLNYLTAGAFESVTELGEEELGGYIGSRLNALAREMGATVSPQAYKLGETLSNMKAHEVAAIFGYSYALGLWGIPANYRSARTFAQNTDNLLKAGHTPATARDIQHRAFQTEDKIADIAANPNLSPEQKAEAIRKEEQDFCVYQQNKFNNEILSDPNLRSRLQKEGRAIRDEAEVALDVEHEADLQILKDNGILQAVIIPGQKYQVAFLEEGETKEDGTRAPGKLITQEWSRTQLTNWLMLQKNTRIEQDLRSFNSLLLAHAHAQSATPEETKTHFQNLGANRPLAALGELHKRGITPDFFRKAAEHALALQTQHENAGMSPQEAAQQPHPDFAGLSLGEVQNLSTDAATRKEQELATTGQLQAINATTNIEYGALNILRRDGTGLIKYVAGKANLLDLLEERFEIDIKQRTRGNKQLADQLAQTLLHIQSHLPGNIRLLDPAKKGRYTQSDFVEAYSKIAIGNFLLNQQNLPINPAGHRLVQNIARAVDTTRMFQTIGNAWLTYANSPEGKAHLEESGHSIADIMREAGFTFSNQIAQARATADQRTEVLQASNWQPAIEDELDALLEDIEAEEQLSEINQQEAAQPTTIPAEESITGQEITIEPEPRSFGEASLGVERPETGSDEAGTTPASAPTSEAATTSASEDTTAPTSEATTTSATDLSGEKATTILSSLRDLIAKGKARAEHFAIVFREIPGLTEAQAIEQGIRPLTQRGEPTAAYTQGKLLAERCTDAQYLLLKSGKLPQKAKRDILAKPAASNVDAQGRPVGDKWPTVSKAKQGKLSTEQTRAAIYKALKLTTSKDSIRPPLRLIKHQIKRGRESFVSTTGTQLSIISRPTKEANLENLYSPITGHYTTQQQAGVHFPLWEQTVPVQMDKATTFDIDLADFRFLEKYPTQGKTFKEVVINGTRNTYATIEVDGQTLYFNLANIRNAVKQLATLARELGFPSQVKLHSWGPESPIRITAEHNGWTWDYLTLPLELRTSSDNIVTILLNPQPSEPTNFSIKPITAEQAESANLFTDGVLEAENAIVTKPDVNFSIKAMHASPYEFYKFSTDFMGSGEGAQAYGWGLYFAEDAGINKHYFVKFNQSKTNLDNFKVGGQDATFDEWIQAIDNIIKSTVKNKDILTWIRSAFDYKLHGANPDGLIYQAKTAVKFARANIKKAVTVEIRENAEKNLWRAQCLEKIGKAIKAAGLHAEYKKEKLNAINYRVELNADDSQLLMWDKPVPRELHILAHKEVLLGNYEEVKDIVATEPRLHGHRLYKELRGVLGSKKAASEWLAAHGYKGIKFLDGNSRSAGEGTYNYVIFSGDDIKIAAINRSGVWSMDEGWEEYTDPTASFSIKPAAAGTLDRFTADPLGERIIHHIRTEARRYARLLGDKTPYEQAVNAAQSAASIISAVDKYLHTPGKPVPARYRRQLQKLRSIAEKYAQIIASGTPRSFKKISPQEKQELETAIAELEAQELDTATTESDQLLTDSGRLTKREAAARQKEHHRAIVRSAAKGRVYQTLSSMLEVTADALDSYLKHQLLQKLDRLTATVKIKRSPSKRLQGKMTAPAYRELERAINLMALSDRAYQDEIENVITAHETLARAINQGNTNLTSGNALLIQLADQLTTSGQQVTPQTLTAALANHEAALKIYGNVSSKNYEQTRLMANALFYLIRNGRNQWKDRHEAREERIQTYLRYFLAHTTPESETANAKRNKNESRKWKDALSLDITMNAAQTIMALSSYEALRPLMQDLLANYSTAAVARQKHLQEIRKQELYAFGRIIGITPATQAGYTDKQLKELSDKFDTFYAENNQSVETTITPTRLVRNAEGELEHSTSAPLKLTKWEALNLILTYRQEHYQPNAQEHGFTPEILTQLENFIGQQMMDYGNAIQKILVNDGTIPVYEEREGIPMRDNPLYWPGHININTINTTRDEPLVNPYHPAASHDFLHARVRNRQEVGNRNAFGVFRKAIADRANYVYADPVTDTITSLLARDQFANRLETLIGGNLKRQLQTVIREIKGAAWQETSLQDATSGIISAAFGAKSLAVLSGNPSSLIRQFSAVANAGLMPGISPQQYLAYAIKAKQNQSHIRFTDILKLDAFTTRARDNAYVNEMIAMGADATFSTLMNWAKTGINAMDKLDLYANAFSATVIYNIKYDQLKAQGNLTEEQIRKRCEQEVAIYTKLLAQPLNRVDKSALYWMIGHHAIGRSLLFMGSEAINKVGMLRANYITLRNQGKNPATAALTVLATMGVTVGIAASITEAALALLLGRTPDDDDSTLAFALALWLNASYGQYLSVIPLLGGVTDTAFSPYGGYLGNESVLPGSQLFTRDIGKLHTMLTDDKEYSVQQWNKEINRFMRNFTTILGYAGGANSQWQIYSSFAAFCQSLTAALNAEGFIFNVAANLTGTADEKTRRPKSLIEQWLTPDTEESPRRSRSTARRSTSRSARTARKRKRQEE